jgi:hypothetical protein
MRKPGIGIAAKLRGESVRDVARRAKVSDGRLADYTAGRVELTEKERAAVQRALDPLPAELLFGDEDVVRALFEALPIEAREEAVRRVIRSNDVTVDVAKAK